MTARPAPRTDTVFGVDVDAQSRCAHYRTALDIVAIMFACCREFYACHRCHEERADHDAVPWPRGERDTRALRCGECGDELSIARYLVVTACPSCAAPFNPGCALHAHLYFEMSDSVDPQSDGVSP